MPTNDNPLLEVSPFEVDEGNLIGKHPNDVSLQDYLCAGFSLNVGFKAIREHCLGCSESPSEVRKCVVTSCNLWPLRMGAEPKALKAHRLQR